MNTFVPKDPNASQLDKYRDATRELQLRNADWSYRDLVKALDSVYSEKESKIEKAFQDVFAKISSTISDLTGQDRLS